MTNQQELHESLEGNARGKQTKHAQTPSRHGTGAGVGLVIGLLIAAAAVFYIITDGADEAVFAYTVDQAVGMREQLAGKKFKVRGDVVKGSIRNKPGTLETKFRIGYGDGVMDVKFAKPLPDTFEEGAEVIAQGKLDGNGALVADDPPAILGSGRGRYRACSCGA